MAVRAPVDPLLAVELIQLRRRDGTIPWPGDRALPEREVARLHFDPRPIQESGDHGVGEADSHGEVEDGNSFIASGASVA